MKLFVIGNARHGKDSVCKILQEDFGLTFESSSCFCAKLAVEPWLKEKLGITYSMKSSMPTELTTAQIGTTPSQHTTRQTDQGSPASCLSSLTSIAACATGKNC